MSETLLLDAKLVVNFFIHNIFPPQLTVTKQRFRKKETTGLLPVDRKKTRGFRPLANTPHKTPPYMQGVSSHINVI